MTGGSRASANHVHAFFFFLQLLGNVLVIVLSHHFGKEFATMNNQRKKAKNTPFNMLKRERNRVSTVQQLTKRFSLGMLQGRGPLKLFMASVAFSRFLTIPPTAGILKRWGTIKKSKAINVLRGFRKEIGRMLNILNRRRRGSSGDYKDDDDK